MRQSKANARSCQSAAGFSLVELMVVVAIVGAMAAVALPPMGRYIRNFRIKGGTQQVSTEINVARSKAIMKNVNLGVVFAVVSPTQYRWVVEDDQQPQTSPNWTGIAGEDWAVLVADPAQVGQLQTLPNSIVFDSPGNCPGMPSGTDTWGLRFTQLGGTCAFGSGLCGVEPPNAVAITTDLVRSSSGVHTVCLLETRTNLRKKVAVSSGGRVLADQ